MTGFSGLILSCFLLLSICFSASSKAAQPNNEINLPGIKKTLFRGLTEFKKQTVALNQDTLDYCTDRSVTLNQLQQRYRHTLNSWGYIQIFNWGPSIEQNLFPSLYYWPDKKNITGRQLNLVLTQQSPESLDTEFFIDASIALTGFSALEQLLFDKQLIESNAYACQFTVELTRSIVSRATQLERSWSELTDADQAATSIKSVIEGINEALLIIHQRKLDMVAGSSFEARRPRLAEAWRSRQSLSLIRANLKAINDLFIEPGYTKTSLLDEIAEHDKETAIALAHQLNSIDSLVMKLDGPLYDSISNPDHWRRLRMLQGLTLSLQETIAGPVSQALGIRFGFSSNDGD